MANELKIYYSSGTLLNSVYTGQARSSIGGLKTDTEVPNTFKNLFGNISLRFLERGQSDYRCVFLTNTGILSPDQDISNLRFYVDVPEVATVTNPVDLIPAPILGDKWIVPENGEGDWTGQDGKLATYNGSGWDFSFPPFAEYEFGLISPTAFQVDDDGNLIEDGGSGSIANCVGTPTDTVGVNPIENIFEAPAGVNFFSANGLANETTIGTGDLGIGDSIALWIKRSATAQDSLPCEELDPDTGGLIVNEIVPIVFNYDTP